MTDEILKLNSNNELVAKDPSTGNTRPIKVADLSASGDISAINLEANTSFIDPAGNEYTGKVGLSNEEVQSIVRKGPNLFQSAQTFAESDLTLSFTGTTVSSNSISLINSNVLHSFENNSLSPQRFNWVANASISSQNSSDDNAWVVDDGTNSNDGPIDGNYHAHIDASDGRTHFIQYETRDGTNYQPDEVSFWVHIHDITSSGTARVELKDSSQTVFARIDRNSTDTLHINSQDTGELWNGRPSYVKFRIKNIDWNNNVFDFEHSLNGGDTITDVPFSQSVNGWGIWRHEVVNAGGSHTQSHDYIQAYGGNVGVTNNGSAILEWEYPSTINEWDVATFSRTLDNETVDVFVDYSSDGGSTWSRTNNGNPISRNYVLANDNNILPSYDVRIEAELSRTNTSNNPTLDSVYRSWFV
jgi:hypothetical protein